MPKPIHPASVTKNEQVEAPRGANWLKNRYRVTAGVLGAVKRMKTEGGVHETFGPLERGEEFTAEELRSIVTTEPGIPNIRDPKFRAETDAELEGRIRHLLQINAIAPKGIVYPWEVREQARQAAVTFPAADVQPTV